MSGERIGSLVGATFGLVYLLVNSGSLPGPGTVLVRSAGAIAFGVVLATALRPASADGSTGPATPAAPRPGAARGYWLTVLAEVVALIVGLRVLGSILETPRAGVAWVSVVVGLHFLVLARVLAVRLFTYLGLGLAGCGLGGFALVALGVDQAVVEVVAGVLPGAALLAAAWKGVRPVARHGDTFHHFVK